MSALPELAGVSWRPRVSDETLRRAERLWTLTIVAHTVPFVGFSALVAVLSPVTAPIFVLALAYAWIIPELYAARGAGVMRAPAREGAAPAEATEGAADPGPERVALGLLGDLVGHRARDLLERTRLVIERGGLGVWVVGEAGALLVRPGGRRVHCYCVSVKDDDLPSGDRIAHLLLALRTDEPGFATVANRAFAGAPWRLRRRLRKPAREALDAAVADARSL